MYNYNRILSLRAEGISIKQIAKKLNISKNTVRKYLRNPSAPEYKRSINKTKILDSFKEEIEVFVKNKYIGTRIFRELKRLNYSGSLWSIYKYLDYLDKKNDVKGTTRFETAPGEQMQYDWKVWEMEGVDQTVYIHNLKLGFSRENYFCFSFSIRQEDIQMAIYKGILHFGGSCKNLLVDNGKQMVISHKRDGSVRFNDSFLEFCLKLNITPMACKAYRAKTKGKVERPFYFVQEQLLKGYIFESSNKLTKDLEKLTEEMSNLKNRELKQSPKERFEKEKESLQKLLKIHPCNLFNLETRKVSNEGYVHYNSTQYPVDLKHANKTILLENILGINLRVYLNSGDLIKEFELNRDKTIYKLPHEEHYKLNEDYSLKREKKQKRIPEKFKEKFELFAEDFILGLKKSKVTNINWHLSEILLLLKVYSKEKIEKSLKICIKAKVFNKSHVVDSLNFLDTIQVKSPEEDINKNEVVINGFKRDMNDYANLSEDRV